jgi:hypothetical protein
MNKFWIYKIKNFCVAGLVVMKLMINFGGVLRPLRYYYLNRF